MRLRELQKYLLEKDIGVALFLGRDANIAYFAGVRPDFACLAVPSSGSPLLFVPGFEAERFARDSLCKVVQVDKQLFKQIHNAFPAKRIGISPGAVSYSSAQAIKSEWNAELVDVEQKCTELRVVKTREEISRITKACALTDSLFEEFCENLPFKSEADAAAFLRMRIAQFGCEPSFAPIVAAGKNAATPHHVPSSAKLSGFTVVDFGILYNNYCSDLTRTIFVGTPSEKDKKVYHSLLSVQEKCIKMVLPGKDFDVIDKFAHKSVGRSMIHRVGHSLGIEVHDVQPRPFVLKQGSVVTIEPGTYHAGSFGIRIEDDVLVAGSPVVLTRSSKELRVFRR